MSQYYCGAISYADDLMLFSPTARGLQKQIQICEEYAKNFGMSYNPVKSFCVLFSRKPQNTFSVKLEERELVWRTHAKHLGNYIASDCHTCGPDCY